MANGWRVAALPDRVYPGLVPADRVVAGLLISDLTAEEWRVLDAFEDEVYELRRLPLADGGHGWAYVCHSEAKVCAEDWDPDRFVAQHLAHYIENCASWRRRYDIRAGGQADAG